MNAGLFRHISAWSGSSVLCFVWNSTLAETSSIRLESDAELQRDCIVQTKLTMKSSINQKLGTYARYDPKDKVTHWVQFSVTKWTDRYLSSETLEMDSVGRVGWWRHGASWPGVEQAMKNWDGENFLQLRSHYSSLPCTYCDTCLFFPPVEPVPWWVWKL